MTGDSELPKSSDTDRQELIKLFEISKDKYDFFHNALWENEKHFTWWISILIASVFVVFTSDNLGFYLKNTLVISLSVLGLLVSSIGYKVIRKEGVYFKESQESFNRISKALKLNEKHWELGALNEKFSLIMDFKNCPQDFELYEIIANKPLKSLISYNKKSVRDFFQLLFIIFFIFFICIIFLVGYNYFFYFGW